MVTELDLAELFVPALSVLPTVAGRGIARAVDSVIEARRRCPPLRAATLKPVWLGCASKKLGEVHFSSSVNAGERPARTLRYLKDTRR